MPCCRDASPAWELLATGHVQSDLGEAPLYLPTRASRGSATPSPRVEKPVVVAVFGTQTEMLIQGGSVDSDGSDLRQ